MRLQSALFPGYVFVRLALHDRLQLLQFPSVARFVSFNGAPAALPDAEIEARKKGWYAAYKLCRTPRWRFAGACVIGGPIEGRQGIVVRKENALRFVISLDLNHVIGGHRPCRG